MTSTININTIDVDFPVAGIDNDSQGFRDNFSSIKAGLATAKSEITGLQSAVLLNANLTSALPVDNDLNGSSINNGSFNNFFGVAHKQTINSLTPIDVSGASIQVFTMLTNINFTFRNWPDDGFYGKVTVHFTSDGSGTWTPTLYTENGGVIKYDDAYPSPFTLAPNGKHKVIEAWTYNGGTTVYVKYLGEF